MQATMCWFARQSLDQGSGGGLRLARNWVVQVSTCAGPRQHAKSCLPCSVEKKTSTKPILGAQKVGGHYSVLQIPACIAQTDCKTGFWVISWHAQNVPKMTAIVLFVTVNGAWVQLRLVHKMTHFLFY